MEPVFRPSPNFGEDRISMRFVVLHGTWMNDDEAALTRLCSEEAQVSCHYYIDFKGKLYQLVKDEYVAWHAGESYWHDVVGLNKYSLGVEIANPGEATKTAYNEAQYVTLEKLLKHLMEKYNIRPADVLAHSDIAPHRKDDPGIYFDWERLESKGLAQRPVVTAESDLDEIRAAGYTAPVDEPILRASVGRRLGRVFS